MDTVPEQDVTGWNMTREDEREDERGKYTVVRVELDEDDEGRRGWRGTDGAQRKVAALLPSVGQPVDDHVALSWLVLPCEGSA